MLWVNVHEAKIRLSRLLARVQAGAMIIMAKRGVPVAKLVPFQSRRAHARRFGKAKRIVQLSAGRNAPLSERVLDAFQS